jgi:hypothetical protein
MPTHMPHRHGISLSINRCDLAGIGKAGILGDRQRIHIRAQHHCWPFAVAEQPNHTSLTHSGCHFVASLLQSIGGNARRSRLLHRQFGVGVDVLIEGIEIWQ